jgi:hypothetical protein
MEENYLLAKWLNNELSDAELKEFQSTADFLLFEKIKYHSSLLKTSDFNEQEMFSSIKSKIKNPVKVIPFYNKLIFKIAAILIIALSITYYINNSFINKVNVGYGIADVAVKLPDSSIAILNDGSQLNYSTLNWKNNRKINLVGEAFFKVAKGKTFEVNTNLGKVTVLGTQFNVKARNKRFDITCFEGKVKVNYNSYEVVITKGETVSFENNKQIIFHTIKDQNPAWIENELQFEKEEFNSIIEEVERQFNISINSNQYKSTQLFTGKIPSNNLDVALQIIASSYHIKIIKTTEKSYSIENSK